MPGAFSFLEKERYGTGPADLVEIFQGANKHLCESTWETGRRSCGLYTSCLSSNQLSLTPQRCWRRNVNQRSLPARRGPEDTLFILPSLLKEAVLEQVPGRLVGLHVE